jgi:hypothetical protein
MYLLGRLFLKVLMGQYIWSTYIIPLN